MKKLFYLLLVTLGLLLFQLFHCADAQNKYERQGSFKTGNSYQITAPSGMNLRDAPATSGKVLAKVPLGETVTMTDRDGKTYGDLTVDNIDGHWVKARYGKVEGYIFSGYFYRPYEPVKPEHKDYMITFEGSDEFHQHFFDPLLNWYGLYRKGNQYEIRKVVIHCYDPNFVWLATDQPEGEHAIVLIGSRKKMQTGPTTGVIQDPTQEWFQGTYLHPGDQCLIDQSYESNTTYSMLSATGSVRLAGDGGINELSGEPMISRKFKDYKLLLSRYGHNGEYNPQTETVVQYNEEIYWPPKLIWYGDLDGDGRGDFILEQLDINNEDIVFKKVLYLSSEAKAGKLIQRVAGIEEYGGC